MIEEINEVQLYNLDADPGETKDLAQQHPKIVADLQIRINTARTELGDIDVVGKDARVFDPQPRTLEASKKMPKNLKK
jgi:hypothetical protein